MPRLRLNTKLVPYRFEMFTAGLLQAMGYRAEMTPASSDGGIDVTAYRDPLGLEPPIIKVQCKRTVDTIGGPDVQKLMGTLAPGSIEVGLFITLGTFTVPSMREGRAPQVGSLEPVAGSPACAASRSQPVCTSAPGPALGPAQQQRPVEQRVERVGHLARRRRRWLRLQRHTGVHPSYRTVTGAYRPLLPHLAEI